MPPEIGGKMNAIIVITSIVLCVIFSNQVSAASLTGHYVSYFKGRQVGKLEIEQISNKEIKFEIYSVGGGGSSCNLRRIAHLNDTVAVYRNAEDDHAMAKEERPGFELVFKFHKDKVVIVDNNIFELTSQYCGMRANGSIGGTYMKKSSKPLFQKSDINYDPVYYFSVRDRKGGAPFKLVVHDFGARTPLPGGDSIVVVDATEDVKSLVKGFEGPGALVEYTSVDGLQQKFPIYSGKYDSFNAERNTDFVLTFEGMGSAVPY